MAEGPAPAEVAELYGRHASATVTRHRSVRFDEVHRRLLPLLPPAPADVLDVGCGSGRDALALAAMGHRVVAADPSPAMLAAARAADGDGAVLWIGDGLPRLERVRALGRTFDLVLCASVLMHVAPDGVATALGAMAALLRRDGLVVLTTRDPVQDDAAGLFHRHGRGELLGAAERAGLWAAETWREPDVMRGDRHWDGYLFVRR